MWWTAALGLVTKLLGIFFPDKSAEKVARDDGIQSGVAQQQAKDEGAVIQDVQTAKSASAGVDSAVAGGVSIRDDDGFRRND